MAHYHPADELLMQYAAGQLANALGLMVACHLEVCPLCRSRLKLYDNLGGELLSTQSPVAVSDSLLNNTLGGLNTQVEPDPIPLANLKQASSAPRPLRRFINKPFQDLPWQGISKSIQQYDLPIQGDGLIARFYKIAAGKELPEHTHRGNEYTLVMEGSFCDKAGDYHAGDFILADTQTRHQPRAHDNADCICFAVMDAPIKFTGFWGRMLNPFL